MIWSKKLRLFRERLALSLAGRIGLHSAGYHAAYEERGRTWLTLDKQELFSFCDFTHENAWRETGFSGPPPKGIYGKYEFGRALGHWLDLSIDDALASEHPLVLALAMLDRRLGKRRLLHLAKEMDALPKEARTLLGIRLEAEGLRRSPDRASANA